MRSEGGGRDEQRAPAERQGHRYNRIDLEQDGQRPRSDEDERHEQVLRVPIPGRVKERREQEPPPGKTEEADRRHGADDREEEHQRDPNLFGEESDRRERDERHRRRREPLRVDVDPRVGAGQPRAGRPR